MILDQLDPSVVSVQTVNGDGSCFFHSLVLLLNQENPEVPYTVRGLRDLAVQGILGLDEIEVREIYGVGGFGPEDVPRQLDGTINLVAHARQMSISTSFVG